MTAGGSMRHDKIIDWMRGSHVVIALRGGHEVCGVYLRDVDGWVEMYDEVEQTVALFDVRAVVSIARHKGAAAPSARWPKLPARAAGGEVE